MKVVWTAKALDDLAEIGDFVASDNPDAAARLVDRLLRRVELLARFPRAGRVVHEFEDGAIREVIDPPYRIVYRVRARSVRILTVFEGHRTLRAEDLPPNE